MSQVGRLANFSVPNAVPRLRSGRFAPCAHHQLQQAPPSTQTHFAQNNVSQLTRFITSLQGQHQDQVLLAASLWRAAARLFTA